MLELNPENQIAGVLAPVFAIRGANDLGVGDTEAIKELISWTARQGLSVVQILPINETGGDSSPYNLLSAMAIEPTTIATLPGVIPDLTQADFERITARFDLDALRQGIVQYREVKKLKRELLYASFKTFRSRAGDKSRTKAFADFERANADWLQDYATHRALVSWHEECEISEQWPREHRSPTAVRVWMESLTPASKRQMRDLMRFHAYVQWTAYTQWLAVRIHAEHEGVALMGDIPVGVSRHSADVWREPDIFDLKHSSGAPPEKAFRADPFTEKWGQNWGFPLYNWESHGPGQLCLVETALATPHEHLPPLARGSCAWIFPDLQLPVAAFGERQIYRSFTRSRSWRSRRRVTALHGSATIPARRTESTTASMAKDFSRYCSRRSGPIASSPRTSATLPPMCDPPWNNSKSPVLRSPNGNAIGTA